jgi:hypothetical protein
MLVPGNGTSFVLQIWFGIFFTRKDGTLQHWQVDREEMSMISREISSHLQKKQVLIARFKLILMLSDRPLLDSMHGLLVNSFVSKPFFMARAWKVIMFLVVYVIENMHELRILPYLFLPNKLSKHKKNDSFSIGEKQKKQTVMSMYSQKASSHPMFVINTEMESSL